MDSPLLAWFSPSRVSSLALEARVETSCKGSCRGTDAPLLSWFYSSHVSSLTLEARAETSCRGLVTRLTSQARQQAGAPLYTGTLRSTGGRYRLWTGRVGHEGHNDALLVEAPSTLPLPPANGNQEPSGWRVPLGPTGDRRLIVRIEGAL